MFRRHILNLYLILVIDMIIILASVFTSLPSIVGSLTDWPIKAFVVYGSLAIFGLISAAVGASVTLQYFRGKRKQSLFLGPCLALMGLMIAGEFLFILAVLNNCWALNLCL